MRVNGRVALVTGASRGIGREIALALARRGALLALVARDAEALAAVARAVGPERAQVIPANLAEPAGVRAAFAAAMDRFGRVDILVNNAGIAAGKDFLHTDPEELARIVDVNLRAAVLLTRLAAAQMAVRRSGHIVNVASLAGVTGLPGEAVYALPGEAVYAATKAALRLFTASLRPELAAHRIRLTDVVLGFVPTEMLAQVESHPRVARLFARARRLHLMVDTPARTVAEAVAEAVERDRETVVLPARARLLFLPLQGLARTVTHALTPRSLAH